MTDKEKVTIPSNVIDIINEVVSDLDEVAQAVTAAGGGSYVTAVEDLIALVQHIIEKFILPKVTGK